MTWATFVGDDGSWCAVRMRPDEHGRREVREGGPIASGLSSSAPTTGGTRSGRPGWDRLGLTVTPDGRHRVWLDEPDGAHAWSLPT
jgi:hypothetical protein